MHERCVNRGPFGSPAGIRGWINTVIHWFGASDDSDQRLRIGRIYRDAFNAVECRARTRAASKDYCMILQAEIRGSGATCWAGTKNHVFLCVVWDLISHVDSWRNPGCESSGLVFSMTRS